MFQNGFPQNVLMITQVRRQLCCLSSPRTKNYADNKKSRFLPKDISVVVLLNTVVRVTLLPLQEAGDNNQFCWRNLFSCINLLRILNKLTKWKHSRTMVRSCPLPLRPSSVSPAARPWLYTADSGYLWKCWSFYSCHLPFFLSWVGP